VLQVVCVCTKCPPDAPRCCGKAGANSLLCCRQVSSLSARRTVAEPQTPDGGEELHGHSWPNAAACAGRREQARAFIAPNRIAQFRSCVAPPRASQIDERSWLYAGMLAAMNAERKPDEEMLDSVPLERLTKRERRFLSYTKVSRLFCEAVTSVRLLLSRNERCVVASLSAPILGIIFLFSAATAARSLSSLMPPRC
jgi:hypothetical protein